MFNKLKAKNKIQIVLVFSFSILFVYLFSGPGKITEINLPDEILATLPSCKLVQDKYGNHTSYTLKESNDMTSIFEACIKEQSDYIKEHGTDADGITVKEYYK